MPTYSYRCTECEKAFDVQQSFTDASLTVCPSCHGVLRKVFSPIGVSFTGSGFYRNDSRATPAAEKGSSASSEKTTEKTGEKTGEKSSDKSGEKSSSSETKPAASSGKESSASKTPAPKPTSASRRTSPVKSSRRAKESS